MKKGLILTSIIMSTSPLLAQTPAIPRDEGVEARVENILKRMTLDEKVGQMCELTIDVISAQGNEFRLDEAALARVFNKYKVGSILNVPKRVLTHPLTVTITGPDGKIFVNTDYHRHYRPVSAFYRKYNEPFEALGAVRLYPLGDTVVRVCDCRQMLSIMGWIRDRADRDLCDDVAPFPAAWWQDFGQDNA